MRKVIGIGETLLDIIFRANQPTAAVPGGSVFNAIVSLSRTGVPVNFISETGNDRVGDIILRFMRDNRIPTDHVYILPNGKSPVSLAFLDEHSDAEYLFYKNYPIQRLDVPFPRLEEDDIVIIGSYYALNPVLREKVVELLEQARRQKAIVYYDPNFRSAHKEEAIKLAPNIIENLEYADIVRGSEEDFFYMYGLRDTERIYKEKIKFYCPNFLCARQRRGGPAHGVHRQGLPHPTAGSREHHRRGRQLQRRHHLRPAGPGRAPRQPEHDGRSHVGRHCAQRHGLCRRRLPQLQQLRLARVCRRTRLPGTVLTDIKIQSFIISKRNLNPRVRPSNRPRKHLYLLGHPEDGRTVPPKEISGRRGRRYPQARARVRVSAGASTGKHGRTSS